MGSEAVIVRDLRKTFRVFSERNQTLKQAVLRRRRAVYEEFVAVDGVSFDIQQGSTFGIIGSNGSGKSTTLKVLAKILEPDGGTVETKGRVSALLELGAGFHPELSGRENVYLNASILGIPRRRIDAAFDQIVDFAELGRFIDNPVKTYSSGMYARLGFAVAVNVDPDVLLIDEVLAVGDENFQRRCAERIDDLRSEGRTVIIVSHGLGSIQTLCDQVAWIERSKLRMLGSPKDVIAAYLNDVHPDSTVDSEGLVHVGSGEAKLRSVEIKQRGVGTGTAQTNRLDVQIGWEAAVPVERVVINVVIRRTDGVKITSLTTRRPHPNGFAITPGPGSMTGTLESFPVVPGTYEVDVEIADVGAAHVFDRVIGIQRFEVGTTDGGVSLDGVIVVPETWA
jgi:ABC-2 type transport system ATP-binding protein